MYVGREEVNGLEDIVFGCTLPLTNNSLATSAQAVVTGAEIAFKRFNSESALLYPNLRGRNLTLRCVDDQGDSAQAIENVKAFMDDPQVLGLLFGFDYNLSTTIQTMINGTDFSYIGPFLGNKSLRIFQRNLINTFGSLEDELTTVISWLTFEKKLQKIAFIYSDDIDGNEAFESAQQLVKIVSLSLVSVVKLNINEIITQDQLNTVVNSEPEAILYWCDVDTVLTIMSSVA